MGIRYAYHVYVRYTRTRKASGLIGEKMSKERRYTIVTGKDIFAPPEFLWQASWNDFDLDVTMGMGPTEEDAVRDLVTQYDFPAIKEGEDV